MSDLWRIWNPFSREARHSKKQAQQGRVTAEKLHEDAITRKVLSKKILTEQRLLSEELRKEYRRNHFGELFQIPAPPTQNRN